MLVGTKNSTNGELHAPVSSTAVTLSACSTTMRRRTAATLRYGAGRRQVTMVNAMANTVITSNGQSSSAISGTARTSAPASAASLNGHSGAAFSVGASAEASSGRVPRRSTPPGGGRSPLRRSTRGQLTPW
jgi:hypothetical protein